MKLWVVFTAGVCVGIAAMLTLALTTFAEFRVK